MGTPTLTACVPVVQKFDAAAMSILARNPIAAVLHARRGRFTRLRRGASKNKTNTSNGHTVIRCRFIFFDERTLDSPVVPPGAGSVPEGRPVNARTLR